MTDMLFLIDLTVLSFLSRRRVAPSIVQTTLKFHLENKKRAVDGMTNRNVFGTVAGRVERVFITSTRWIYGCLCKTAEMT